MWAYDRLCPAFCIRDMGLTIPVSEDMISDYGFRLSCLVSTIREGLDLKDMYQSFPKRMIRQALRLRLIEKYELAEEEIIAIVRDKEPQKISILSDKKCEWCSANSYIFDKHHLRKNRKVVRICGCCHNEFHYLERISRYRLTKLSKKYY